MSRDKGVELPVESAEDDLDAEAWWEDEDLLEDPLEVAGPGEDEEDEVESTMAEDEDWADEDLLEEPDAAATNDPRWDEATIDGEEGWEDVGDWDGLLEDPNDEAPLDPEHTIEPRNVPPRPPPGSEDEEEEDDTTEHSWQSPLVKPEVPELDPLVVSWRPITRLLLHNGLRIPAAIDLAEPKSWLVCNWSDGERGQVVLLLETGELELMRGPGSDTVVLSLDIEGRRVDALLNLRPTDGPVRLVLGRALLAQHRFLVDPA